MNRRSESGQVRRVWGHPNRTTNTAPCLEVLKVASLAAVERAVGETGVLGAEAANRTQLPPGQRGPACRRGDVRWGTLGEGGVPLRTHTSAKGK